MTRAATRSILETVGDEGGRRKLPIPARADVAFAAATDAAGNAESEVLLLVPLRTLAPVPTRTGEGASVAVFTGR